MLKPILASLLAFAAFAADEAPKKPSFAEDAYNKAIEANSKDVYKNYDLYLKSLEAANQKIVKALEGVKADLNNVKKGSMSLTDRADAIKAIDEKIAELKKGALGEIVVRKSEDLLGEGGDIKKLIVGKWKVDCGVYHSFWTFTDNGLVKGQDSNSIQGKWKIVAGTITITSDAGVDTMIISPTNPNIANGINWKDLPITYERAK